MKKLIKGIVDYRQNVRPLYREKFARLALGQNPDTLFIACSDSRVVPNTFASTDPGDLFVVRNVGNLIPPCGIDGHSSADESEAAAIEFSVINLNVSDIVVCGHSQCGAMHALLRGRENVALPNLREWLRHGEDSIPRMALTPSTLNPADHLSQLNVLQQIDHLLTYPIIRERILAKKLNIHGWWFELTNADVYAYSDLEARFNLIDEVEAERIILKLN